MARRQGDSYGKETGKDVLQEGREEVMVRRQGRSKAKEAGKD